MSSRRRETGLRVHRTSRIARSAVLGLSAVALTTSLIGASTPTAHAEPALTLKEAKAKVDQLQTDAAALDQQWVGLQQNITDTKTDLTQRQSDLKAQTAKVAALRTQLSQMALAEFQNRNLDTRAQLFMTRDTQGFLSQVSTVEKVNDNQNKALQSYQSQQANLADLQRSEAADLASLQTDQKKLTKVRKESDKKVADAKAVLAKLTEEQRKKLEAEKKRQEAAARKAAEKDADSDNGSGTSGTSNARTGVPSTSKSTSSSADDPGETGSGKGAEALAFAKKQLGKPYRFGATGPGAYDCSGLTLAAWRSAGVHLSRTSQSQIHDGSPVDKSDLKPGDLVFFYSSSSPSHVGLYAGNGMVLHAPKPGSSVEYIKMSYMPFSGARRPG